VVLRKINIQTGIYQINQYLLSMARANRHHLPGYVWMYGGYNEIENPKQRYSLIDRPKLTALLGLKDYHQLLESHRKWVADILKNGSSQRNAKWTESIANDYFWQIY
jgi:hypothetical protein